MLGVLVNPTGCLSLASLCLCLCSCLCLFSVCSVSLSICLSRSLSCICFSLSSLFLLFFSFSLLVDEVGVYFRHRRGAAVPDRGTMGRGQGGKRGEER